MEIKKTIVHTAADGTTTSVEGGREYIFFTVKFNHFRDVSGSSQHIVTDREEWAECECVLALPESYTDEGAETPLIIACHGAGSRVCAASDLVGGLRMVPNCIDAGYAALDVCGSEPHGLTMGCPEHIFAIYKAYRYVIKHYNLSERVLVTGRSMGGHVAMNFANTFPGIVIALGLCFPRLNMDSVEIDGHHCIGTWDKQGNAGADGKNTHSRIMDIYHFPTDEWCEENTIGFNPYRTRSFVNSEGKRVVIPPCPIKIWQGTEDKTVDPVMVEEFVNSVRRSNSYIEFHKLDGVTHQMTHVMRDELLMWFNRFI